MMTDQVSMDFADYLSPERRTQINRFRTWLYGPEDDMPLEVAESKFIKQLLTKLGALINFYGVESWTERNFDSAILLKVSELWQQHLSTLKTSGTWPYDWPNSWMLYAVDNLRMHQPTDNSPTGFWCIKILLYYFYICTELGPGVSGTRFKEIMRQAGLPGNDNELYLAMDAARGVHQPEEDFINLLEELLSKDADLEAKVKNMSDQELQTLAYAHRR